MVPFRDSDDFRGVAQLHLNHCFVEQFGIFFVLELLSPVDANDGVDVEQFEFHGLSVAVRYRQHLDERRHVIYARSAFLPPLAVLGTWSPRPQIRSVGSARPLPIAVLGARVGNRSARSSRPQFVLQ